MCEANSMNGPDETSEREKGERAFLRLLADEIRADLGPHGFGDDMAPLELQAGGLMWSTDMLMDGIDFESEKHAWREIGHKAMAVSLSDCAASAAAPIAAVCAVALNNKLTMADALELYRGMRDCGEAAGCPITGGDTNSWDSPTVVSVTVAAKPDEGRAPVSRAGARPGDRVFLTGAVGGSILGRHLRPEPRIQTALMINRRLKAHAMIDISDGLVIDLWHICEASAVGAVVDANLLDGVVHPDARLLAKKTGRSHTQHALYDGEDFELIVATSPETDMEAARRLGLLPLGEITAQQQLLLRERDGRTRELEIAGWEHFRD